MSGFIRSVFARASDLIGGVRPCPARNLARRLRNRQLTPKTEPSFSYGMPHGAHPSARMPCGPSVHGIQVPQGRRREGGGREA